MALELKPDSEVIVPAFTWISTANVVEQMGARPIFCDINPDTFNMLGFSNRKLGNNDEAFSYYNKALDIDPEHLGTHEYIGRLYLNLDQPEESKKHFRILKALCYFGCEELKSLEKAIKEYEMGMVKKKH